MAPRTGAKGFDLEEKLRAYFHDAGYYVVRGVPFRLDGEDVTDIDLWLYERPVAINRRVLIVDIKNRRSPKATERLIWVKGLQDALGVDGAIVATTDRRDSTRRLARTLGVAMLDGEAISRLPIGDGSPADLLTNDDIDAVVKKLDASRRSSEWREEYVEARGALLSGLGVQSANRNLSATGFFAVQAINAQPNSWQAELACRISFLTASIVAISLDFMLSENAFRPGEDVRSSIVAAIRYGESGGQSPLSTVRAALSLLRNYADNGAVVAKQVEQRFRQSAEQVKAELIADFLSRGAVAQNLFTVARELQVSAFERQFRGFDSQSAEARSFLGVALDFNQVSRAKFAQAWTLSGQASPSGSSASAPSVHPQPPNSKSAGVQEPAAAPLFSAIEENRPPAGETDTPTEPVKS